MKAYINSIAAITPQNTFEQEKLPVEMVVHNGELMHCLEADYKKYIDPVRIRRMSRIMKMGLSSAKNCIDQIGGTMPDAILTATGYGCMEDTEKFLISVLDQDEKMLNPTPFMQSTHNSISGIVALNLACKAYNYTYVNRGFSVENALLDALLLIAEGDAKNVLLGAFEENSKNHHTVFKRIGLWKEHITSNKELYRLKTKGSLAGESTIFLNLCNQADDKTLACLQGLKMIYKPTNAAEVKEKLAHFLRENELTYQDVDLVVSGRNGDVEKDVWYDDVLNNDFPENKQIVYKHLSGEFHTSVAFALYIAAHILKEQFVPDYLTLHPEKKPLGSFKNILIYNHYQGVNHSFIRLSFEPV